MFPRVRLVVCDHHWRIMNHTINLFFSNVSQQAELGIVLSFPMKLKVMLLVTTVNWFESTW